MLNFIDTFMKYTEGTERTIANARWCAISLVAASLARRVEIPFGHFTEYPNMYIFLVGAPATRKSTIIKIAKRMLVESGYKHFAFKKTTREQFLLDFEEGFENLNADGKVNPLALLDKPFVEPKDKASECFICADEFVDFIGLKNFNFLNTLTTLYDCSEDYPDRVKNSKSILIRNPTVNILGGLTPTNLGLVMPEEMIGQGLTSRLLLINSGELERKITFPEDPCANTETELSHQLRHLQNIKGKIARTKSAGILLDEIYKTYIPLSDGRLQHYCARRFVHLLKLCAIMAACKDTLAVDTDIVIQANTILSFAENQMHLALGEFGESKLGKATQKIMEVLANSSKPLTIISLWEAVSVDLDKMSQLYDIISNLERSHKIIRVEVVNEDSDIGFELNKHLHGKNIIGVDYAKYIPEYSKGRKQSREENTGGDSNV